MPLCRRRHAHLGKDAVVVGVCEGATRVPVRQVETLVKESSTCIAPCSSVSMRPLLTFLLSLLTLGAKTSGIYMGHFMDDCSRQGKGRIWSWVVASRSEAQSQSRHGCRREVIGTQDDTCKVGLDGRIASGLNGPKCFGLILFSPRLRAWLRPVLCAVR